MLVEPKLFALLKSRSRAYAEGGYEICDPLIKELLPRIEAHENITVVFTCEGHSDSKNPRMTIMFACLDAEAVVKVESEYIRLFKHLEMRLKEAKPVIDDMLNKHGETKKVDELIVRRIGRNFYDRMPSLMIETKFKKVPRRDSDEYYLARTIAAMVPTEISKQGLWEGINEVFFR
jgi:hypothetical protein